MNNDIQKEYSTRDLAYIVDIATPTIRKYAQLLEKSGYKFLRNEQGHRIFTDSHIGLFREMKALSKQGTVSVERIADILTARERGLEKQQNTEPIQGVAEVDTPLIEKDPQRSSSEFDERYALLMKKLEKLDMLDDIQKQLDEQRKLNERLVEQLAKQQYFIETGLDERDKKLMDSISQLKEERKALNEVAASKRRWWDFFR